MRLPVAGQFPMTMQHDMGIWIDQEVKHYEDQHS